jgi:hypothetical protein
VDPRWERFSDLPSSWIVAVLQKDRERWREVFNGPRYRRHDRVCGQLVAMHV